MQAMAARKALELSCLKTVGMQQYNSFMETLKTLIREIPDFPKAGILFYDITTLLKEPAGLRGVIDGLKTHYQDAKVDAVIGIEARGFIFALPWRTPWAPDSCRCASRRSCPPNARA